MPQTTDILLSHAAGLRALVRRLVSDEHATEDVLQETWVAAIERGPGDAVPLAGWLRRVARNLALKRRRGDGRRFTRERGASRDERLASTQEVLAQRDSLRQVTEAVLGLDEPYQTVILCRYFQNQTPPEIAERLGVPVATVSSRLHRARERLRERLDEAAGGEREQWALALAACTGLGRPEAGLAGIPGGWAMQWKVLVGAASVAVITMGASVWSDAEPAEPGAAGAPAGGAQEGDATVSAQLAAPERGEEAADEAKQDDPARVAVGAVGAGGGVTVRSEPLPRFEYVLRGKIVDGSDLGMSGAQILLAPVEQPLNVAGVTGSDGTFELRWRADAPRMDVALLVHPSSGPSALRRLTLDAGTESLRLAMHGASFEQLHLRMTEVQILFDVADAGRHDMEAREEALRRLNELEFQLASERLSPPMGGWIFLAEDESGVRFRWPTIEAIKRAEEQKKERDLALMALDQERAAQERLDQEHARVAVEVQESYDLVETRRRLVEEENQLNAAEPLRVTGTVYGESGAPVGGASVLALDGHGWIVQSTRTADDGRFALALTEPGNVRLRAGGGSFGIAERNLAVAAEDLGAAVSWDPLLDRGREIEGTVVDAAGKPVRGLVVEVEGEQRASRWSDVASAEDGSFSIPNVPGGGLLLVRAPSVSPHFPIHVVPSVWPDAPLEVRLPDEALVTGTVVVEGTKPLDAGPYDVRLWQQSTGRGAWLHASDDADQHRLGRVPAGSYRVVVGTLGRGYADLGVVEVISGETVTLTAPAFAPEGHVTWDAVADAELGAATWTLLQRGDDVAGLVASGTLDQPFADPLPAGAYLLAVDGAGLAAPARRFEVRSGETTRVDLALGHLHEVVFRIEGELDGARLEILDAAGAEVHACAAAEALLLHLGSGDYRARVRGKAGELELPFEVAGDSTRVDLRLP
ncbi:MAG: sigma-70 family RNA polymerase sigma factor [Planctomycetota bacterium]